MKKQPGVQDDGLYRSLEQQSLQSKVEYLQRENSQLQEQVEEFSNLLALNRQALKLLTNTAKTSISSPVTTDKDTDSRLANKGVQMVLKNLQEENEALLIQIERIILERNQAQNQVFLNQQITEAAQRHEQELIQELEHKINSLNRQLQEKDLTLLKLEQTKPDYDEVTGIVIKYREILAPDEGFMKLHDEIQMLNDQLVLDQKRFESFKKEKTDLQTLNFKLTTELLKLRTSAITHHGNQLIIQNPNKQSNQISNILQFQSQIIKNLDHSSRTNSSEAEGSLVMSPLPLKNEVLQQKGIGIPKLDLTRAKQIQEINAKRQIQQMQEKQQKNVDYLVLEKLQKQERQLDDVRRSLQREMLLNRTFQIKNDELIRINEELEHRNQILAVSNIHYEENWRKIHKQYSYLQQFYIQNKDQLNSYQQSQTQSHHRKISQPMTANEQYQPSDHSFFLQMQDNLEKPLEESFLQNIDDNEDIQQGDGQIKKQLQGQYYPPNEKAYENQINIYQYYAPENVQDSKKFLLNVAKGMYMLLNQKFEQINQNTANFQRRQHQRSLSDILDYQNNAFQKFVQQKIDQRNDYFEDQAFQEEEQEFEHKD